ATHRLLSTGGLSGFSTLRGSNKANAPRPSFFCKNTRLASTCASSRLCVDSTRGAVRRCGEASPSRCTKSAIMGKSSTPAATVRPAGLGDQGSRRGSPFGSGLEAGTNGELYGARLIVVKVRPVPAITPESAGKALGKPHFERVGRAGLRCLRARLRICPRLALAASLRLVG